MSGTSDKAAGIQVNFIPGSLFREKQRSWLHAGAGQSGSRRRLQLPFDAGIGTGGLIEGWCTEARRCNRN
jgi:hypothetical protein